MERFCYSSKREKNNYMKVMVRNDLLTLKHHCKVDMEDFLYKIKKEEMIRKTRAIYSWKHFNYSEIED